MVHNVIRTCSFGRYPVWVSSAGCMACNCNSGSYVHDVSRSGVDRGQRMKWNNLTGQRFGKLIAVEYMGRSRWRCQCDCGNVKEVRSHHLMDGSVTSCGCRKRTGTPVTWSGCEEDCFNCKYEDCKKPDYMCHERIHRRGPHVD